MKKNSLSPPLRGRREAGVVRPGYPLYICQMCVRNQSLQWVSFRALPAHALSDMGNSSLQFWGILSCRKHTRGRACWRYRDRRQRDRPWYKQSYGSSRGATVGRGQAAAGRNFLDCRLSKRAGADTYSVDQKPRGESYRSTRVHADHRLVVADNAEKRCSNCT